MEALGLWLRRAREAKGVALKEAEEATCIKARFLEMLEAGSFASFPGGHVQVRGFLRIYARYLDIPPENVLTRYDREVRGVERAAPSAAAPPPTSPAGPPTPSRPKPATFQAPPPPSSGVLLPQVSMEMLVVISIVLAILLVAVIVTAFFLSRDMGPGATATATVPAGPAPGATESVTDTGALTPTVTPALAASIEGDVTLALEATEHVWVRVKTGETTAFEGLLAPGQVETWTGEPTVTVETGNGAGLLVSLNEQSLGKMCGRGEVCTRAWGPTGEISVP